MMLNSPLANAIITIITINLLMIYYKPKPFFNHSNMPKNFGTRAGEIVIPYYNIAILVAILVYIAKIKYN